jgi:serine-protein kinase ATM
MQRQGKVLPMPETVPFRLTRDLVDAMGATGTEGAFRQCCNTTMAVLRRNAPSLLTILEVCVHDPLHSWVRAAVAQLDRAQGGDDDGDGDDEEDGAGEREGRRRRRAVTAGGNDAQRALLRIRQKLQGYQDPGGDPMSIDGHVRYLISEATDPNNLCRIFSGWSPWV